MENKKLRTPAAAILLAVGVLLSIFETIFLLVRSGLPVMSVVLVLLPIIINLALCCILFSKKRNIALVSVLALHVLYRLINIFRAGFSLSSILYFAAYALLLVFALALSEPQVVNADLSKLRDLAKKLYFLPAVLLFILWVYTVGLNVISNIDYFPVVFFSYLISFLPDLLTIIAVLCLAQWLVDPYEKEKVPAPNANSTYDGTAVSYDEAYCGLGKHIVLCLFTFGIWYMIWIYRVTKYLNQAPGVQMYYPGRKLLLCLFVPFYQIFWFYKHGQRIDLLSKQKKLANSDMATLCLILGIFIPIVACILMQDRINALCCVKSTNIEA